MPIEDIKHVVEIVLMALAAAWALVGFFMLKQRQKAIGDVRKLDLEAKKLELDSRQTANVEVEIEASSHFDVTSNGFLILAEVILKNIGSRDTRIEWQGEPAPFSIRRTTFDAEGCPQFAAAAIELRTRQARDANSEPISTILRAKGSQHLTFAARVSEPGLYLLAFRGSVGEKEAQVSTDAGAQKFNPTSWTCTKFLLISATGEGHDKSQNDG
jgi:hypothetical protein